MYAGKDVRIRNLWDIWTEQRKPGEGGLTKKGEEVARRVAIRQAHGFVSYSGETAANIPVTGVTSAKAVITKKQAELLISEGRELEKSPFTQDVAEPVVEKAEEIVESIGEALDPMGTWWDKWKIVIGIGAGVVGGSLLLGYSGLGKPIGALVESKITKEDK